MQRRPRDEVDRPPEQRRQLVRKVVDQPAEPGPWEQFVQQVNVTVRRLLATCHGPEHLQSGDPVPPRDRGNGRGVDTRSRAHATQPRSGRASPWGVATGRRALLITTGLDETGARDGFLLLAQFLMGSVVMEHAAPPAGSLASAAASPSADERVESDLQGLIEGLRALALRAGAATAM